MKLILSNKLRKLSEYVVINHVRSYDENHKRESKKRDGKSKENQ